MSLDTFRKRTLAELSISQEVKDYAAQAMKGITKEDFIAITIAGIAALWLDSGFGPNYVISKPFLLTHGAQDRANGGVFPRSSAAWTANEPNCRYEVIPNAGHTAIWITPRHSTRSYLIFSNRKFNNGVAAASPKRKLVLQLLCVRIRILFDGGLRALINFLIYALTCSGVWAWNATAEVCRLVPLL